MADNKVKGGRGNPSGPDESWVKQLTSGTGEAPEGVTTYVGLLRQSPSDENIYWVYLSLDMRSCLHVQKADVLHWEDLPPDKSPFGSLGGCRIYVRLGAKVKAVTTSTNTLEAGAEDEFDLDVRLGARRGALAAAAEQQTIPDTGCGPACEAIPPFTFGPNCGFLETAFPCVATVGLCGVTINTCVCPPTQGGKTCGVNCQITRALTCVTRCGTCQTCQTQCGTCVTCGTCRTQCGQNTCNTCNTRCGQETCGPCNTHIFTACNHNTCNC
ncbi:MAG: hypothetical protein M3373_09395 [Gemmatimonadota bacterium]|nr:hypothetical protein [Gemmatimonadota bacterium]